MGEIILELEISLYVCKECGAFTPSLQSTNSSYSTPFTLWIGKTCSHLSVYWQDAYYDETLRERFLSKNMICPKCHKSRLTEIDKVDYLGENPSCKLCSSKNMFLLSKQKVDYHNVLENEK